MLTNAAARAAAPQARAYKLFDERGLYLYVAPTGLKSWRLKYRQAGREKLLTLGRFPEVPLADARRRRDAARAQLAGGGDPAIGSDLETFEQIARAWHAAQRDRWSASHAADVLASLERDAFPVIGGRPIGEIAATDLLHLVRAVERRGCSQTARRLRQRLSAVFGYAMTLELVDADPAANLGRAMAPTRLVDPHPALTDIDACRKLLAACEDVPATAPTRLASRFLALTAVRLDAVRGARWEEIEGLGSAEPMWRVPPARMKLARLKKDKDRFAHLVPLSAAAIAVLRAAAGGDEWPVEGLIFPGRAPGKPIGEGAIGALYSRAGFAGLHVPHGWRASFSTILNEARPDWRADIDRALAHSPKDKVEAAYNRAALLDRRREIFDQWGAMLVD